MVLDIVWIAAMIGKTIRQMPRAISMKKPMMMKASGMQQSATMNEMGMSVQNAASASSEIAKSITSVAGLAATTSNEAANMQRSARDVGAVAQELSDLVGHFRYE